jgi:integrase/recombinase XerC
MAGGSRARDDPRLAVLAEFRATRSRRRLSLHTSSNYCRDIESLFELTPGLPLERIQTHVVRRAIAQLHGRGLSGKTLARMLSSWRGLFAWLARHRGFAANPCTGVRAPKSAKTLPKALSPDAASQLLDRVPEGALEVRDKAMFELCYSSGLRLAELVRPRSGCGGARRARASDRHRQGRKTRTVPVGNKGRAGARCLARTADGLAAHAGAHCSYPTVGTRISARRFRCGWRWARSSAAWGRTSTRTCCDILSPPMCSVLRRSAQCRNARPLEHLDHPGLHAPRLSVFGESL